MEIIEGVVQYVKGDFKFIHVEGLPCFGEPTHDPSIKLEIGNRVSVSGVWFFDEVGCKVGFLAERIEKTRHE